MSDLIDDPIPGSNTPEFSVGEIAGAVKKLVEGELGWVRVRGEVGRVVLARSGHLYFDLKDDRNELSCMPWKGQVPGIGVLPEDRLGISIQVFPERAAHRHRGRGRVDGAFGKA